MSVVRNAALLSAPLVLTLSVASAAPAASTTALKARLSGSVEVPEKGDPNGSGSATVRVKGRQVCYSLRYKGITAPNAAHIHRGAKGEAGPVVVALFMGKADRSGCVKAGADLARAIAKRPAAFYVNVHNAKYPAGALRGQLRKR